MVRIVIVVLMLLVLAAGGALAQNSSQTVVDIWNRGATAYNNGDMQDFLAAMQELEELRPHQLPMAYNVAAGFALTGQTDEAVAKLEAIAASGLYVDVEADDDFASLGGHPRYGQLLEAMESLLAPSGDNTLVAEYDMRGVLPEGVAVDRSTGDLYISSVHLGEIWRVREGGEPESFVTGGAHERLGGILGLAVDRERNLLWAASSTPGQYVGPNRSNNPPSTLFAFDLTSGDVRHHYPLDGDEHFLGEVIVAPDGRVYASDSGLPVVYRVNEDLSALEPYFVGSDFTNFQGIDVDEDGRLYIADYVHGLIVADPVYDEIHRLSAEDGTNLSGIDGLFYVDGSLIAIRNGAPPHRIMRFTLSGDRTRITDVEVLASNLAAWDEPTLGQIVGDRLIYNAASGWPDFTDEGEVAEGAELDPIRIMSVDLGR